MKTIWIKEFEGYIVDAITYDANRDDYHPLEVPEMPFDIMCGCYQLNGISLIRDEIKHAKMELERSAQNRIGNLSALVQDMLSKGKITEEVYAEVNNAIFIH